MTTAKCIQKIRGNNNKIIGYKLQDEKGNEKVFEPKFIKEQIQAGCLEITNLALTSDNRLIAKTPEVSITDTQPTSQNALSKEQADTDSIQNYVMKAMALGREVKEIPTSCGHTCYLISQAPEKYVLCIPNDVTALNHPKSLAGEPFTKEIRDIEGHIKVVGGTHLKDTHSMFEECKVRSLDLSSFDTRYVEDMKAMFCECKAQSINFSNFNTSSVKNMCGMFHMCEVKSLDLSSFDTRKVEVMCNMFQACDAQSIDLHSFNTSAVTNMGCMFMTCEAQSLDLSNFDTRNVDVMCEIFRYCKAQFINISNFNISNVRNGYALFDDCNAEIVATDAKILMLLRKRRIKR